MLSLERILTIRYIARMVLFIFGLTLTVIGALILFGAIAEGFIDGDLMYLGYYGGRICMAVGLGAFGLVLVIFAGPIARGLTPIPKARCPKCDYSMQEYVVDTCPECGLYLGTLADRFRAGKRQGPESRRRRSYPPLRRHDPRPQPNSIVIVTSPESACARRSHSHIQGMSHL